MLFITLKDGRECGWHIGERLPFPWSVTLNDVDKVQADGDERTYCERVLRIPEYVPRVVTFTKEEAQCIVSHILVDNERDKKPLTKS